MDIAELKPWKQVTSIPVHMFCDAAGRKPYMGVVVFIDAECLWTHMAPPRKVMCRFRARSDNQIMGLELLAISLGLSTFERRLRGRKDDYPFRQLRLRGDISRYVMAGSAA